jgi:hypothetical protein
MDAVIKWLLEGDPWTQNNTRLHLLSQDPGAEEVLSARQAMLAHPLIQGLIAAFDQWEKEIVSNHKNAGLLLHKLCFLADIGLTNQDPGLEDIVQSVLRHRTEENVIQVPINVPRHFGGSGQDAWGWCLCDTPTVLYALAKLGLNENSSLLSAAGYLMSLSRVNGWGCQVSPELGKFRGPGKKDDPCPYATLIMLKALAQLPAYTNSAECRRGAESLLQLWADSRARHPYMFFMGTDFRKLKAPFVWYDILHVADVLSQFEWLRTDSRLLEMVAIIRSQADENGLYTPQSEWKAWNGWEFGQKKKPSQWLTYLVLRLLRRFEEAVP